MASPADPTLPSALRKRIRKSRPLEPNLNRLRSRAHRGTDRAATSVAFAFFSQWSSTANAGTAYTTVAAVAACCIAFAALSSVTVMTMMNQVKLPQLPLPLWPWPPPSALTQQVIQHGNGGQQETTTTTIATSTSSTGTVVSTTATTTNTGQSGPHTTVTVASAVKTTSTSATARRYYNLAHDASDMGDIAEAERLYRKTWDALNALSPSATATAASDTDAAEAVDVHVRRADVQNNLALLRVAADDSSAAAEHWHRALVCLSDALKVLAAQAEEIALNREKAATAKANLNMQQQQKGEEEQQQQRQQQQRHLARRVLTMRFSRSNALRTAGQYAEALDEAQLCLAAVPRDPRFLVAVGAAAHALGRSESEWAPLFAQAEAMAVALSSSAAAAAPTAAAAAAAAVTATSAGASHSPNTAAAAAAAAEALLSLGTWAAGFEPALAQRLLLAAARRDPGMPPSQARTLVYTLGRLYEDAGNTPRAQALYAQAALAGVFPSPKQRPAHVHLGDGLVPGSAWLTPKVRSQLAPAITMLEDAYEDMRDELLALLGKMKGGSTASSGTTTTINCDSTSDTTPDATTCHTTTIIMGSSDLPGARSDGENLTATGSWRQTGFVRDGHILSSASSWTKFPRMAAVLKPFLRTYAADLPRGAAELSLLAANTHVKPHCGPTNHRLRLHLPLLFPPEGPACCGLRANDEMRQWKAGGRVLAFDDSFEHEAYNNGTAARVVLLVDVWHPALGPSQRQQVRKDLQWEPQLKSPGAAEMK